MKALLIALICLIVVSSANRLALFQSIIRSYQLYSQCDVSWGSHTLGTSSRTICQAGCLMSSVAMVLHTSGVNTNPDIFNNWLISHGGYVSGNLFVWDSIKPFGFNFKGFFSAEESKKLFDQGQHVILNVNYGGHYVLMTGYSGSTFFVNDPGYNKASYGQNEVVETGVYRKGTGAEEILPIEESTETQIMATIKVADNRSYQLFKQCDGAWGSHALGNGGGKTICQAGCLMTSVTMMVKTGGTNTNPDVMNNWLKTHNGYASGNLFIWASVAPFGYTFVGFQTAEQAKVSFDAGNHVILNVHNGGHYVLMTGYSGSTFQVNDPGFSSTSYQQSEIKTTGVYKH